MKKIKILIVDDHKMIREGICSMLELYSDKYGFIVDIAETGELAIKKAKEDNYDLIIMDYRLPGLNGVRSTREIRKQNPKTKILALSNYDEFANITSMMKAGAKGFILKNIGSDELLLAIESILNGKTYYSSDVALKLINYDPASSKSKRKKAIYDLLSERELEILQLITREYTNVKIAKKLKLSKRTIDKHRQHLLEKLNTNNTVGLIKKALELNLFN